MLLPSSLILLILCWRCHAAQRNVTIDDSSPDPETGKSIVYEPPTAWKDGKNCNSCTARPEASGLYDSSWHDSTFNALPGSNDFPNQTLSASATFTGTAVYVICALALTTIGPYGNSDMTFFIDGNLVGTFVKPAPGLTGYKYNETVYYNTTLHPGDHTIRIQNGHVGGNPSLILLDRIIYTTGTPDSTSSSSPSATNTSEGSSVAPGTIAGAVVGGVVGLLAFIIAIFLFFRSRIRERHVAGSNGPTYPAAPHADTTSQLHPFAPGTTPSSDGSSQPFMSVAHRNGTLYHSNSANNLYTNPAASGSFAATGAAVVAGSTSAYGNNHAPVRPEPSSSGASNYDPYGGYQPSQSGQSQTQSSQGPPSSTGAGYGAGAGYVTAGGVKADYHPQMVAHNRGESSSAAGTSVAGDVPPPAYEGHAPPEPTRPIGKR